MEPEEDCSTEWFKKFSQLRIELHMDHIMTAFLLKLNYFYKTDFYLIKVIYFVSIVLNFK